MEVSCTKRSIEVERLVGGASFQIPVRAEAAVPGAGRESVETLMEDAFASVTGAEAQAGRVLVTGQVQCQAVYRLGEEGGLKALTARAGFEQAVDMEGAQPQMAVRARAAVEHVEAAYDNGHMVFQVTVAVMVRVRSLAPVEAVTEIAADEPVEALTSPVCSARTSAENSETARLSDSVSLPGALHARVVLMQWAEPRVESAERDLGGVRVSGAVQVESLIASSVAGRPVALVRCQLPFEQLVAMPDWLEGEPDCEAEVQDLNVEVEEGTEGGDAALKLECALQVTARLDGEDCVDAVSDAYVAGGGALALTWEALTVCAGAACVQARETFRGALLLPEGAPGAGAALAARVRPVVSGWEAENGAGKAQGVLEATVLYMPSGGERLASVRTELPFSIKLDAPAGEDAALWVTASEAEASALMSDRMELKCVLTARGVSWKTMETAVVTDAQAAQAEPRRRGMGVYYPSAEDTLWTVGRRYRIPLEQLKADNGGLAAASAGTPLFIRVRG
ncbi:MAG: DUF3794 domain-containing protein [Clostridia bacterium]|nr:DUF3794 domain-containing protein [Clostridia bacterium]